VTRLWRAGTSPPVDAAAAAAAEVERFASMGAYRFLLPPFWPNDSVNERRATMRSSRSVARAKTPNCGRWARCRSSATWKALIRWSCRP
jgi:hypothetical protein